ncbi:MAG: DUF1156 domain-containing protein [Steroidobacteraceae bacterium]
MPSNLTEKGISQSVARAMECWAQQPLAAARSVIFAQMVDDRSALPQCR